jgi:hypothetical protein
MQKLKLTFSFLLLAGMFTLAFLGCQKGSQNPSVTSNAKPATKLDAPTLTCGSATQVSINLNVCAGATGAAAGFSVQWMTLADYVTNGNQWYLSEDPRLCKASFSGNANDSRYALTPNQCVSVNIGELLFDNGTSTNCPDGLTCGTAYVFRSFAHNVPGGLAKSDWSANRTCSTLPCQPPTQGCTYTQGYWKTHGPVGCNPSSGSNTWPVTSLTLGSVSYSDAQLCSILNTPAAGNGILTLAHQLIAAKLNIANGADGTAVAAAIAAADAMIGGLIIPPVGVGFLAPGATSALVTTLANYNEGLTGPGHCN